MNEVTRIATTEERYAFYHSAEWRMVRTQAVNRDNRECQWCKAKGLVTTKRLEVDHIKELKEYPELALTLSNLRTLCHQCHNERHNRINKFNDEIFEF